MTREEYYNIVRPLVRRSWDRDFERVAQNVVPARLFRAYCQCVILRYARTDWLAKRAKMNPKRYPLWARLMTCASNPLSISYIDKLLKGNRRYDARPSPKYRH